MIPFFDLKRQTRALQSEMDRAWREVTRSGWFVLGRQGLAFEREFAAYLGVPYAIGVASGTEALELALTACGIGADDEVLTVANTAVPTVCAIETAGARPVFVEVDPLTRTMDPADLSRRVTRRTRAILPVHLYGHSADMDPIRSFAKQHSLMVVEDACQAHGAEYRGRKVGTLSDAGCFSFYPSKNLGAFGDGGMVVTRSAVLARRLRLLRNYGQVRRYRHVLKGFNSRLDELQAAILRPKLRRLDAWNARRRRWAGLYAEELRGLPLGLPTEAPWARHCFHLYVVQTKERGPLARWLERRGIQTLVHYPVPIYRQPAYLNLKGNRRSLPVTDRLCGEILSLPLYPEMRESEIRAVGRAIRAFFQRRRNHQ